jgi:hypothetical protein
MKRLGAVGLALGIAMLGVSSVQATTIDNWTLKLGSNGGTPPVVTSTPIATLTHDSTNMDAYPSISPVTPQPTEVPWTLKDGPLIGGEREFQLTHYSLACTPGDTCTGRSTKDVGVTQTNRLTLNTENGLDASLKVWWDGANDGVFSMTGLGVANGGTVDLKASACAFQDASCPQGKFIFDNVNTDKRLDVTIILCKETTEVGGLAAGTCIADTFEKPPFPTDPESITGFFHCFTPACAVAEGLPAGADFKDRALFVTDMAPGDDGNPATRIPTILTGADPTDADVHAILHDVGAIGLIVRRANGPHLNESGSAAGSIDLRVGAFHTNHVTEAVPEPGTISLMGLGIIGLGIAGFLRNRRKS